MLLNNFKIINMKRIITLLSLSLLLFNTSTSQISVSGKILTETGLGIEGVVVGTGSQSVTTDANGNYSLILTSGDDYTITPNFDGFLLNGVSTFDKVKIEQHVLGVEQLDSPYKMIAADINKSGTITSGDAYDLYNALLFITPYFPNNTSWRFVPADFVFPNPANPFESAFPEVVNLNALNNDITDLDFIAIKVGDVNGTVTSNGTPTPTSLIKGYIYADENNNCQNDNGEPSLADWLLVAKNSSGDQFFGKSNNYGHYSIYAEPGIYDVFVVEPNALWDACTDSVAGVVVTPQVNGIADFGAHAVDLCPYMEVNLTTPFLRRCFNNTYYVMYTNKGTEASIGSTVEVTLDDFFTNIGSSLPWTSVNGNTYTFDIGDVPVGHSDYFIINFTLDCNAVLGQTHCSSAHIYPEPPCTPVPPQWTGGDIEITAECDGPDVKFTITNNGDDMTTPVNYIVIEDIMIQMTGNVQLNSGDSVSETFPANGKTYRMTANEVSNHPFETIASAAIEGCGTNGNGTFSLGFINAYPLSDEEPFEDEDCQENLGSFDPNDKTGFPLGYDAERYIEKGQDIHYRIRFQNTGSDTAFNVVILDTLPPTLDPATIRIVGFSHPMDFDLLGSGVAKFQFSDILLPDSNVNEALSHGFVKFVISQRPELELGTTIQNDAAIYFDFNDPVITNKTLHTIGEPLIEVTSSHSLLPDVGLQVFPNPFDTYATFKIDGLNLKEGKINLMNSNGQVVRSEKFQGSTFEFDGSDLPRGIYFFNILTGGTSIANGKIIIH